MTTSRLETAFELELQEEAPPPPLERAPSGKAEVAGQKEDEEEAPHCTGCCSCPHGVIGAASILATMCAWGVSSYAAGSCDFVLVDMSTEDWIIDREVGISRYMDADESSGYAECKLFSQGDDASDVYDSTWIAARVLAIMAAVLGLVSLVILLTASCVQYRRRLFSWLGFTMVSILLFYGLTFIVFGSDVCQSFGCELGAGGICMVAGLILWAAAAATTIPQMPGTTRKRKCLIIIEASVVVILLGLVNGLVIGLRGGSTEETKQTPTINPTPAPPRPHTDPPGPSYCKEVFGDEITVCEEDGASCTFFVVLGGGTCEEYCLERGWTCVGAAKFDNVCQEHPPGYDPMHLCTDSAVDEHCTCVEGTISPTEPETFSPTEPETFMPTTEPRTACQEKYDVEVVCEESQDECTFFHAINSNCRAYCGEHGGYCLAAFADSDDNCSIQEPRTCYEFAGDMICTCSM